jgi:hypothetical protein
MKSTNNSTAIPLRPQQGRPEAIHATIDMEAIGSGAWLRVIRRYLIFIAVTNLIWEFAQLPLYTIWDEGTTGEIVFAAVHCTGRDVLISGAVLLVVLMAVGTPNWPRERIRLVALLTILCGLAYTIFSEWLNIEIRGSWAYSDLMPIVPIINAGLSPISQWIVIPVAGFWWAHRPFLKFRN